MIDSSDDLLDNTPDASVREDTDSVKSDDIDEAILDEDIVDSEFDDSSVWVRMNWTTYPNHIFDEDGDNDEDQENIPPLEETSDEEYSVSSSNEDDNEIQQVPCGTQQNTDIEGRRGVARVASKEKVEVQAGRHHEWS